MVFYTDYFQHKRDWLSYSSSPSCSSPLTLHSARKQQERQDRISTLPPPYHLPVSSHEETAILRRPIEELVQDVQKEVIDPVDILRAYGKVAIAAHGKTNCLTEIMLPQAEEWAHSLDVSLKGPLAGLPVSLKDSIAVESVETSVGYSSYTGRIETQDGIMVRILKRTGAIPFVKTNLPISLLSFESTNDVWGRTTNPHNSKYSPGGSTGGEAALLAFGGSRIGIGSDVAGSVRAPAHFSGIYSLRCSTGRWPKVGFSTSMPGQEGIPSVYSPMTRTLSDLTYFTRSIIQSKPWELDYSIHPLPWRNETYQHYKSEPKLTIGLMTTDNVVKPSPACTRALQETAIALRRAGHTVHDITPPSPLEALKIASILLNADGCRTFASFTRFGEWFDTAAAAMYNYMRLPWLARKAHYLYTRYIKRDDIWADVLNEWTGGEKSAYEQWKLVARREAYKARFFEWWDEQTALLGGDMDVILCPVNALPATPHDAMGTAAWACGYTFLWNLLDYTAGVIPVTKVDAVQDRLPPNVSVSEMNGIAKGIYRYYDAVEMAGLPVGVQIVGRRLQEEKVLAVMERVEAALEEHGKGKYEVLEGWKKDA
jgi:Asp-tRNA(Asn)/Glu-tRNA(Gln) amidotransferase A subunit family amidase